MVVWINDLVSWGATCKGKKKEPQKQYWVKKKKPHCKMKPFK